MRADELGESFGARRARGLGGRGGPGDDVPGALARQPPTPGPEEERRPTGRAPAPPRRRGEHGPTAHEVGVDRGARVGAERDDPVPAALADEPDDIPGRLPRLRRGGPRQLARAPGASGDTSPRSCRDDRCHDMDVVDVEGDRLADAGTGAVEQLDEGSVTQGLRRRAVAGRRDHGLDLRERQGLGEATAGRGRADVGGRIARGAPFEEEEAVEATDGDERAGGRGGGQRRVLPTALAQRHDEVAHVGRRHREGVVDAVAPQVLPVSAQVPGVGARGVYGQTPLDPQVPEPVLDRGRERIPRRPGGRGSARTGAPRR